MFHMYEPPKKHAFSSVDGNLIGISFKSSLETTLAFEAYKFLISFS